MSLPKWVTPVAIAVGLMLVLVLSMREPKMPDGSEIIDSQPQFERTIQQAHTLTKPIFDKVQAGGAPTDEEKQTLIQGAKLIDNALKFNPISTNLYVGASRAYFYAGQPEIAEARVQMAIRNLKQDKDPRKQEIEAEAYYLLAELRFEAGDYEGALEYANKAVELQPNAPDYLASKASVLIQMKKFTEADEVLHKALGLFEQHPRSRQLHELIQPDLQKHAD